MNREIRADSIAVSCNTMLESNNHDWEGPDGRSVQSSRHGPQEYLHNQLRDRQKTGSENA
jgi:hypothetical protein